MILGFGISAMKRREFITLLGGATAWSLAARAQQAVPVVGFLNPASPTELASRVTAFHEGLRQVGYVEGQNVVIEYRWAEGQRHRLPDLAADLVRRRVAVIAATGSTGAVVRMATSQIPIVFTMGADPVETGLVASFNRPGGNVTGITQFSGPIVSKRIGLLRDIVLGANLIAVLVDPSFRTSELELQIASESIRTVGWRVTVLKATGAGDLDAAFEPLVRERPDALLVTTNPVFESQRDQIVALAARHAVPAIYGYREYPAAGGLMSYGASITDSYRQAGMYTGRLLKGERPADMPILLPTTFELVINLKTAKMLRLTIPPGVLAIADEVIE
jgi:putative tryptophan/tyrosine transport system substrate-binding protein